jgi:hypothetical protein
LAESSGAGQFPLIKYGSLGGAGFGAFALGAFTLPIGASGSASLVNDTANQSIDLNVVDSHGGATYWDGTINGNWDIGGTANWKTNAYYTQSNGLGPAVMFNDAASGPNTSIILNTTVTPDSVTVSNSALTYSIQWFRRDCRRGRLDQSRRRHIDFGRQQYLHGRHGNQCRDIGADDHEQCFDGLCRQRRHTQDKCDHPRNFTGHEQPGLRQQQPAAHIRFRKSGQRTIAPAIERQRESNHERQRHGECDESQPFVNAGVAVLLRYAGDAERDGQFRGGRVPAGVTVVDDTVHQQVLAYIPGIQGGRAKFEYQ